MNAKSPPLVENDSGARSSMCGGSGSIFEECEVTSMECNCPECVGAIVISDAEESDSSNLSAGAPAPSAVKGKQRAITLAKRRRLSSKANPTDAAPDIAAAGPPSSDAATCNATAATKTSTDPNGDPPPSYPQGDDAVLTKPCTITFRKNPPSAREGYILQGVRGVSNRYVIGVREAQSDHYKLVLQSTKKVVDNGILTTRVKVTDL